MSQNSEGQGVTIAGLVSGVVQLALVVFVLTFLYGVVRVVLQQIFGVDLPNPFDTLPLAWRQMLPG